MLGAFGSVTPHRFGYFSSFFCNRPCLLGCTPGSLGVLPGPFGELAQPFPRNPARLLPITQVLRRAAHPLGRRPKMLRGLPHLFRGDSLLLGRRPLQLRDGVLSLRPRYLFDDAVQFLARTVFPMPLSISVESCLARHTDLQLHKVSNPSNDRCGKLLLRSR